MARYAAIDFETANRNPNSACSIGVVLVEDDVMVDSFYRLIRPPERHFEFTWVHGLTFRDVEQAPVFDVVWQDIMERMGTVDFLVAHNASFDAKVLRTCCELYACPFPEYPFLCSVKLSRKAFDIRKANLKVMCEMLDIQLNHHHAESDAQACARIMIEVSHRLDLAAFCPSLRRDDG